MTGGTWPSIAEIRLVLEEEWFRILGHCVEHAHDPLHPIFGCGDDKSSMSEGVPHCARWTSFPKTSIPRRSYCADGFIILGSAVRLENEELDVVWVGNPEELVGNDSVLDAPELPGPHVKPSVRQ